MTTSDLVARLTARANLTYSYPIEDILLLRGAANEIERLREALERIVTLRPKPIGDSGFQQGPRLLLDQCQEIARAALAEKEEK